MNYTLTIDTGKAGESVSLLEDTKGKAVSVKFHCTLLADTTVFAIIKARDISLIGGKKRVVIEFMCEPVWNLGEGERLQGTYDHAELFQPRWMLLQYHDTFTIKEAVFLSLGVNEAAYISLFNELRNGNIETGSATELEIPLLRITYNMRKDYVTANMSIFGTSDGKVDRRKFHDWAKSKEIPIPDEFVAESSEKTNARKQLQDISDDRRSRRHNIIKSLWHEYKKDNAADKREFFYYLIETTPNGIRRVEGNKDEIEIGGKKGDYDSFRKWKVFKE